MRSCEEEPINKFFIPFSEPLRTCIYVFYYYCLLGWCQPRIVSVKAHTTLASVLPSHVVNKTDL